MLPSAWGPLFCGAALCSGQSRHDTLHCVALWIIIFGAIHTAFLLLSRQDLGFSSVTHAVFVVNTLYGDLHAHRAESHIDVKLEWPV
ncbi:MAG: hypothetical protein CMF43_02165 [Legionellales bacterium]|nr:hypothetical protein [Legionellales bacterium]